VKSTSQESEKKKSYEKPKLRVYGDIRAVTKSVGMGHIGDGGKPTNKTH